MNISNKALRDLGKEMKTFEWYRTTANNLSERDTELAVLYALEHDIPIYYKDPIHRRKYQPE